MNDYCTVAQFFAFHDRRVMKQLSGDENDPNGNAANVQLVLDAAASRLDSYLSGRVSLPIASPPPAFLTMLVSDMAAGRLYGRRSDKPKAVDLAEKAAEEWVKDFSEGRAQIPGVARLNAPALVDS